MKAILKTFFNYIFNEPLTKLVFEVQLVYAHVLKELGMLKGVKVQNVKIHSTMWLTNNKSE